MAGVDVNRAGEMAVFETVARTGSFSAAARVLGLTPSAVSRTVARTEARLGVRLLIRTTRSLVLTAEGETFVQAARRILSDLNDAEQAIADQGAPRGRLRVSAALSHGRLCVVPLLGEFLARYPHIIVDVNLTDTLVNVAGGQADVAVRFGPLADSGLTARKIGTASRVVVASPAYLAEHGTPLVPEDLHSHNCINFNFRRVEPLWPFVRDGQEFSLPVKGNVEANNGETLSQLAVDGVGVTRVGAFSVADHLAAGRLVPVLEAFNPGDQEQIHAVFVGGTRTPARVRVFVDFLSERLKSPSTA